MFTGTLFPKQVPAAEKLLNKKKMLLAWEQGTGKTVISLAASDRLLELGKIKNVLVLGRPGDYWQWAEKLEEFTDSGYTLAEAKKKDTRTYKPTKRKPYCIVPWTLFRRDYATLSRTKWDLIIADECQEFRNYQSKTGQLIKRLNTKVKPDYRWALTGTAISTKLEELYSIMYWVDPKLLPPWPAFQENHLVKDNLGVIVKYKNLNALNDLLVNTRLDRKTHDDFKGQMPELVEQIHKVPSDSTYKNAEVKLLELLDSMAANIRFDDEGEIVGVRRNSKMGKAFHTARQALISPAKLSYCRGLIDSILSENPNNRIVIFCYYKQPIRDLHAHYGRNSKTFTGDDNQQQKRDNIAAFRSGDVRLLFATNAGEAGLDLPFANYVIHLDIPFSFATLDQRNKRITRASSLFSTAVVIYLMIEDSIEEFYYVIVKGRGKLAKAVKEGGDDEVIMRPMSLRSFIKGGTSDG